ncbi:PAS domain-containing protein [Beijerinckia sp. L45]|uniref:PAS domain-containing protein n=1 Tax=Beijerinckia sp. L45 TaxID=1641855 RepID=UPI00131DD56D|nr:PAS domain-containing protein [Beijerinckia sp. L45]
MKHQATNELFRYWNELRGERTAPERNEIDPGAIRHVLADTFMLDIDADQRFPFRLAGTRVNALFDAEQKGRSFLDIWTEEERRNLAGVLMTVADGACPVVAGAIASPAGQGECPFELLLLPMRHHGKTHSRILGIIKSVKTPSWLGMLPVGPLKLRSLRIVDGDEMELIDVRPQAGPHRLASKLRGAGSKMDIRPFLRVIEGGASGGFESRRVVRSNVFEVEVENSHL